MSVYKKLQQARIKLQQTELKKSGHNKFADYQYFELGDFLPAVQTIFNELGLCGTISFTRELATLDIVDVEDGSKVSFTSPMGSAALKGCHEVQNIGAVETYQRRYLWVTAMEIVEHDALDAQTGSGEKPKAKGVIKPTAGAYEALEKRMQNLVDKLAAHIKKQFEAGNEIAAYEAWRFRDKETFEERASTAVWDKLSPPCRRRIKEIAEEDESPVAA